MTLGLIGWGVYSLTQLPIDAIPDVTNNQVQIVVASPNLAAQEVEKFITSPIELVLQNLQLLSFHLLCQKLCLVYHLLRRLLFPFQIFDEIPFVHYQKF